MLKEMRDKHLVSFMLSRLEHYVPFLVPYPILSKKYLKVILELWGTAPGEAEDSDEDADNGVEESERVSIP